MLATSKISCAIHTCEPHTTYIHYVHDTSITTHPSHRGGGGGTVDPRWIIYMLATYDHTTYLLPYTQVVPVTLPSPHPPHRGCGGKVDPTSIIYMLAKCQLYRTAYIQDLDHGGQRGWLQG